jgi:hypothetical protein
VQGHLRKEYISIEVTTKCKHCDRVLHLTIDSNMRVSVGETDANPLVFMPDIDWKNFTEQNIIDSY